MTRDPLPTLAVVVPTLNAAASLPATLASIADARRSGLITELVVSDGGSADGTEQLAHRHGAIVVVGPRGRGAQLDLGARAAVAPWLLFLHADTVLAAGWDQAVAAFIARLGEGHAAAFTFALDDDTPPARRLAAIVAWRSRVLSLPYGDQGLLISRAVYDEIGGFRPLPLMEDVDLVRRIGAKRLHILDVEAVTSAARYRRDGYRRRSLRNLACLSLYGLGVPPRLIVRIYG